MSTRTVRITINGEVFEEAVPIRMLLTDFIRDRAGLTLTELHLIVNAVQGLVPGIYRHHRQRGAVELLRAGTFREEAARIAARQRYAGDAHVNLYYLAHLPARRIRD